MSTHAATLAQNMVHSLGHSLTGVFRTIPFFFSLPYVTLYPSLGWCRCSSFIRNHRSSWNCCPMCIFILYILASCDTRTLLSSLHCAQDPSLLTCSGMHNLLGVPGQGEPLAAGQCSWVGCSQHSKQLGCVYNGPVERLGSSPTLLPPTLLFSFFSP